MSKAKQIPDEPGAVEPTLWMLLTGSTIDSMRHLEGQLLTLMDAITNDERQVKAIKDTVKTLLWAEERETEKYIERWLHLHSRSKMPIVPDWLEKRFKKEDS